MIRAACEVAALTININGDESPQLIDVIFSMIIRFTMRCEPGDQFLLLLSIRYFLHRWHYLTVKLVIHDIRIPSVSHGSIEESVARFVVEQDSRWQLVFWRLHLIENELLVRISIAGDIVEVLNEEEDHIALVEELHVV